MTAMPPRPDSRTEAVTLRLTKDLAAWLIMAANDRGISRNEFVTRLLERERGREPPSRGGG